MQTTQKQVFHYVQQEEEEEFSVKEIDKKLRPEKDDFLCTEVLKTTTLMIMMMNIHIVDVCSKIVRCKGGHKRLRKPQRVGEVVLDIPNG